MSSQDAVKKLSAAVKAARLVKKVNLKFHALFI
jgi:hypothetical protein